MKKVTAENALKAFHIAAVFTLPMILVRSANAQGLSQATTVLNTLESNLTTLIPVLATVALMICGVFYAMRMIHKDTFVHWFIGILIAGSAAEITAMVMG